MDNSIYHKEQLDTEVKKHTFYDNTHTNTKDRDRQTYLGINLIKYGQDLYAKNYEMVVKKSKANNGDVRINELDNLRSLQKTLLRK